MLVTAHIKFSLHTTFLDSMLQAEDERLPGESVEDGVIRVYKKLEEAVAKLKDGVQDAAANVPLPNYSQYRHMDSFPVEAGAPPPIINIQDEKEPEHETLWLIQNAPDLDALKAFKLLASSDPTKVLYEAYMLRLKQLTNG